MKLQEFRKLIREEVRRTLNTRRPLTEARVPKSGTMVTDEEMFWKKYIPAKFEDEWDSITDDETSPVFYEEQKFTASESRALVKLANQVLKDNGLSWRVAAAVSADDEGKITWKIK